MDVDILDGHENKVGRVTLTSSMFSIEVRSITHGYEEWMYEYFAKHQNPRIQMTLHR